MKHASINELHQTPRAFADLFSLVPIPLIELDISEARPVAGGSKPDLFFDLPVMERSAVASGVRPVGANKEACKLFGEPVESSLLGHFSALVASSASDPASDQFCSSIYSLLLHDGERCEFEWVVRTRTGDTRDTQVTLTRDHTGEPDRVVCLLLDVTKQRRAEYEADIYRHQLEQLFEGRAGQVEYAYEDMWRSMDIVSRIVEARDIYTAGHMKRVAILSARIAEMLGLDSGHVEDIRLAAAVHDLGKVAIPVEILNKPTELTRAETSLLRDHVELGCNLLRAADMNPRLVAIVAQHHERQDGTGYPHQLRRDAICIGAKVIAVADTVESMCAERPHRRAAGINAAVDEIITGKGRLYDNRVVDVMLQLVAEGFTFDFEG